MTCLADIKLDEFGLVEQMFKRKKQTAEASSRNHPRSITLHLSMNSYLVFDVWDEVFGLQRNVILSYQFHFMF